MAVSPKLFSPRAFFLVKWRGFYLETEKKFRGISSRKEKKDIFFLFKTMKGISFT
jgi:hypothetical protein